MVNGEMFDRALEQTWSRIMSEVPPFLKGLTRPTLQEEFWSYVYEAVEFLRKETRENQ